MFEYYMRLDVTKESSVKDIQEKFNSCYPFLKIEFFKNNSKGKNVSKTDQNIYRETETLKNMFNFSGGNIIDIDQKRTVAELENDFEKRFGIFIQVFRRSGNVWIETTLTDDWTLEQQNKEGEQISSHFTKKTLNRNQSIIDLLKDQNHPDD